MRPLSDPNVREALQFLALATGVLVLLGGGIALAEQVIPRSPERAVDHVLMRHQAGYILHEQGTLVSGAWPRLVRVCMACVLGVLAGLAVAAAIGSVPAWRGWAWRVGRWSMLAATSWGLVAVLFLPPRTVVAIPNGLMVTERPAILGQLSLPLPMEVTRLEAGMVRSVQAVQGHRYDTLRIAPMTGPALELLLPSEPDGGSAFVASALYDHLH